ncbi:Kinesin-like protein [Forsythia ovata]|uniref:Kinesin-like protein n=1 Tax=Forsythia ovata TaxID=205694 RepID=A0ABD1NV14_9LAMI
MFEFEGDWERVTRPETLSFAEEKGESKCNTYAAASSSEFLYCIRIQEELMKLEPFRWVQLIATHPNNHKGSFSTEASSDYLVQFFQLLIFVLRFTGFNILVLVRLRPLSEKEIARDEVADWECINSTTICIGTASRSGLDFPQLTHLSIICWPGLSDDKLSVLTHIKISISATIFAYGQTSSGKTYSMNGITEYSVADIYDYIQRRETIIERLKVETLRDWSHLKELLSILEGRASVMAIYLH